MKVPSTITRRAFLQRAGWKGAALGAGGLALISLRPTMGGARRKQMELRISRILVQEARGRRRTPVAPNAYAAYRGYDVSERILRIQTEQGFEGISVTAIKPELLKPLVGLDPFTLFEWDGDVVRGPAEPWKPLLADLRGADVALLDVLGKALGRPVADLLGRRVRKAVKVYDSSLYMEDLLKPSEQEGLAYLKGRMADDPAEMVAHKAAWVLSQPEGVRILKIKIGRAKWMASFESALERDIAVYRAVRRAVGGAVTLLVDGNDGYRFRPAAAAEFAEGIGDKRLYLMEEMFPEEQLAELRRLKERLRKAAMATKLADGEAYVGSLPEKYRVERYAGAKGEEPLIDIDQADMNASGYLRLRASAKDGAGRGMTLAPHNFGSKLGLYAQIHLGLVTPNWEFCESDDTQIPALEPRGFIIRKGVAQLTGEAGLGVGLREEALEKPSVILEAWGRSLVQPQLFAARNGSELQESIATIYCTVVHYFVAACRPAHSAEVNL